VGGSWSAVADCLMGADGEVDLAEPTDFHGQDVAAI
jgi:hypothetical protein